MNVKLTKQQKEKPLYAGSIAAIMQQILMRENQLRRSQEHFWVLGLNAAGKLLFVELVSLGARNRVQVNPPEVFRMAIYKMAVRMVLVHNHPAGNFEPSDVDIDFTDRLLKVGEMINIEIIDHLIITETKYYSFQTTGIMDKLRDSDTYRIPDLYSKKLESMKIEADKKQAIKEERLTLAQRLIEKGRHTVAEITELTNLKKSQVEKLMKENGVKKK